MNPNTLLISDTGDIKSLAYVIVAFAVSLWMSRKTDRPWISLVVIFWLFSEPIMGAYYVISPNWLPFDIGLDRLLFLFLLTIFLFKLLQPSKHSQYFVQHKPDFTIYIVIYIVLVIVAMVINMNVLTIKRIIAIPLEPITFLLLFIIMRDIITEKMLRIILGAIILMSVVNALIAIYQVAFDPAFFRTSEPRIAFGNVYRAFGIFTSEYILGGFQLIALYTALVFLERKVIKYAVIFLIILSIVVTFHRLDMIILILSILIYLSKYSKKKVGIPVLAFLMLLPLIIIPAYTMFKTSGGESEFVNERLSQNTVTGRFKQFALVIKAMPAHPLGVGSYDHPEYQRLMISHKMTKSVLQPDGSSVPEGLGVHNGFLGVGIQYGIVAMIVFIVLLWKMFSYFYKRASRKIPLTIIPLFAVATWILENVSNGIIRFGSHNILMVALVSGAFIGMYEKGFLNTDIKK